MAKKLPYERNSTFIEGNLTHNAYDANTGAFLGTYNAGTMSGGGRLEIFRRELNRTLPLREKGYTRSLLYSTQLNGRITWEYQDYYRQWIIHELVGTMSTQSGVRDPPSWTALDLIPVDAGVHPFLAKYGVREPVIDYDLRSQVEVKCLNKLRGEVDVADLSFGTLWGERRETCELVADLLGGTVKLMRAVATKDYRKSVAVMKDAFGVTTSVGREKRRIQRIERRLKRELKRTPKQVDRVVKSTEDAILAYNLGISPLVKDVKAAVASLTQLDPTLESDVRAKATYSRTLNDEHSWRLDAGSRTPGRSNARMTVAETHGYTVVLTATPKWDNWTLASRLGIADLSLGWELTSLSFLVDYHLAIGPWLSALNALHEFIWVDGSYTQRVIRILKVKCTSEYLGGSRASGEGLVDFTKRTVYSEMPIPMPPMSTRIRDLSSDDAQDAQANRALNEAALSSRVIRDAINGIFS